MQNQVKGGLADKLSINDVAKKHKISVEKISQQLKKGIDVEMEHVNSRKKAAEIALDHLTEFPDYYDRLDKLETKAKKDIKDQDLEKITKSFNVKNNLNDNIWENGLLKPGVRRRLLLITNDFFKGLSLGYVTVKDVIFTGSLANYNWSEYSDVDLHILIDFNEVHSNQEFIKDYVDAKKTIWNAQHKIKIYNFEVEIYVQDTNEKHISDGVYSILHNKWIKAPKRVPKSFNPDAIASKSHYIMNYIDRLNSNAKYEDKIQILRKIERLRTKLRNYRRAGLEKGGEYSIENLVFKTLRRNEYLGKLKDLETLVYDKKMSLAERLQLAEEKIIFL